MTSWSLWIPLLWIAIIGSRPVSLWFGGGIQLDMPDDYLDGSPLDRNVFLFLIIAGLAVLLRRRIDWGRLFSSNSWLFAFILYCGVSVIWSDHPFVGFKRWIKDVGNIIMVLIILSEKDPVYALKTVFTRYAYAALPLSVVLIKYFPDIGRYYNRWTWEVVYCGIATEKNALGSIAFICGLFLIWELTQVQTGDSRKKSKVDIISRVVLLLMVFWLMSKANSSTALVCLILGSGIIIFFRNPQSRIHFSHLGTYSAALGLLLLFLYSVPGILEGFVGILGRNMTLTGRTDLWANLLKVSINPIIGTGYQSFWLGSRAEYMWQLYYFRPNQAHNGYLETYLNGGLVGLSLLMAMIVFTGSRFKKELMLGNGYGILRFSFFVVVLFYNWTEAIFNKQTLVWFIMIVATLHYRHSQDSVMEYTEHITNDNLKHNLFKTRTNSPNFFSHLLNFN